MTRPPVIHLCSGGLDSTAILFRKIELGDLPDEVVFTDVGDPDHIDPAEWPGTYRYIAEVIRPICNELGIPFTWLTIPVREGRPGEARSLFEWHRIRKAIPVANPSQRLCTRIAKVEKFEAWLDEHYPDQQVEVWVGFEAGEESRVKKDPNVGKCGRRLNTYPLIEWGWCRCRCEAYLREVGVPIPRKSACVFCPMGTRADWQTFARELPDQFARVVKLEADKPPTKKNGLKLSIKNFPSPRKDGTRPPAKMLPQYVSEPGRPVKPKPCEVCGAEVPATKAVGCDWLDEGRLGHRRAA
jgi:hypothetical protein